MICFEQPASDVGKFAASCARLFAAGGHQVIAFVRHALNVSGPGILQQELNSPGEPDIIDAVRAFTLLAIPAFNASIPADQTDVILVGCEWSSIPALQVIGAFRGLPMLLCLQTLERQRSDMSSDQSKQIEGFEIQGIHQAGMVLLRGAKTVAAAREIAAHAKGIESKLHVLAEPFPIIEFQKPLDAGAVKAKYLIGPVDPTFLFVGPLNEDHGPDLLMKAIPEILKTHKQARFIFVGDGPLFWMLRIYSRYLSLDHAVRIAGHLEGESLHELMQAADVVVLPARKSVGTWPILAAWAAGKVVIASHESAGELVAHEENGLLIYPMPDSCAWGACRILDDTSLWSKLVENGKSKINSEFGEQSLSAQLQKALAEIDAEKLRA